MDVTENAARNFAYIHFRYRWIRFTLMRVVNQLRILGNQLYEISFLDKCLLITGHYRIQWRIAFSLNSNHFVSGFSYNRGTKSNGFRLPFLIISFDRSIQYFPMILDKLRVIICISMRSLRSFRIRTLSKRGLLLWMLLYFHVQNK